jgi:hypothetical protein
VFEIFRQLLKFIDEKLLDDKIRRADVFMDKRTWIRNGKVMEVKGLQCGVIRIANL